MIISGLDRPVLDSRDKSGKTHIHMANIDTLPSGPKGLPIVGNTLQFRRDPLHFVRKMQQACMILEATPAEVPTQAG